MSVALISTLAGGFGISASDFGFFITLQFVSFSAASFAGTVLLRSAWSLVLRVVVLCLSQVFYSLGAFAAPQLVYLCFGAGLGWRATFLLFGLFSAAVGLFFVQASTKSGGFRPPPVEGPGAGQGRRHTRVFDFLLLLMLIYVTLESLSAAWLSYVFETRYQLSAREAAVALMLFWAGMLLGRLAPVFLPARWTLWPTLLAASLLLALAEPRAVRYAGVLLLGAASGPMWPVIVMTTSVACRSERRTSAVIGMGALGFASGPLLGTLLLKAGLEARFFTALLALGALALGLCLLAAASRRNILSPS